MKYWLDTEFIEQGSGYPIDLLSIGVVAEDGRELYRQADWVDWSRANSWVAANVLPQLIRRRDDPCWATRLELCEDLIAFCSPKEYGKPEFWAYYGAYDWVALCQLFGNMTDLPTEWPRYCRDIKQLADVLGNPKLPAKGGSSAAGTRATRSVEHHALADAKWNRVAWEYLNVYMPSLAQGMA